ncbi:cyclase family protein [Oscillatoria sp. CS-180]|uniref:cyclase family protein n=1 Tax=Oscillatoria sp. CS-180 TaxID=3021720 RepID=UPI00232E9515|nr:cyclase family protein [Oscillatoria sp. CS-180]MDB9524656.1 cyclase family protein [Oscillatoria sp. CS-180]
MVTLIDVSHTVEDGMITYKGLPAPIICDFLSREASKLHYAEGTTFHIGKIEMVANTGTYIDAPFHRYADGKDLSQLALESVAQLDAVIVRVNPEQRPIGIELFSSLEVEGQAVLIQTGWDRHWRTDQYFENHPYLTAEAAEWLKQSGAALVGIDSLNIDDTTSGARPVHSTLLGADIPIVEHLCNLEKIPNKPFKFSAVPVKVKNFGTFPVRAYVIVEM